MGEFIQRFGILGLASGFMLFALGQFIAKRRSQRAYSFEVITNTALVKTTPGAKGAIQVLYDGKPLVGARLVEIGLRNAGAVPLAPSDFHGPIEITFPAGTELMETEVIRTQPNSFRPELEVNGSTIAVTPCLMNQGDSMVVKTLAAGGNSADPVVSGRIAGIPKFATPIVRSWEITVAALGSVCLSIGFVLLLMAGFDRFKRVMPPTPSLLSKSPNWVDGFPWLLTGVGVACLIVLWIHEHLQVAKPFERGR